MPQSSTPRSRRALVTGATGYIGGRLVPRLLEAGWSVRCLARQPEKLADRPWAKHPDVEIVAGTLDADAGQAGTKPPGEELLRALTGCQVAYYLVHSMISAGADYAEKDRAMAATFATAAAEAGVERIFYLGGLGETGADLSKHLASRMEVAETLAQGPVPVTTFRAAMIIGSGSASFEILRYLVERLPIMITPRWVSTECQPIGIRNVLHYLVTAPDVPETTGKTLDIGGPDIQSYDGIMRIMAEELKLPRRIVLPVPFLTPHLSSLWIHLVTPLSHQIAQPLTEGLKNRVVTRDDQAHRLMPQPLLTIREAIRAALVRLKGNDVETSWSAAGPVPGDPDWAGGKTFTDTRTIEVNAPPARVFEAVCRVGGDHGWYASNRLWRLRGFLDRLAGGPGGLRGRRDPTRLGYGEALDFWRVTGVESDKRLTLRSEMRLPGQAELDFTIRPIESVESPSRSTLTQTARFRPRGLLGLVYWWVVTPFHGIVFQGTLNGIGKAAEARAAEARAAETRADGARTA